MCIRLGHGQCIREAKKRLRKREASHGASGSAQLQLRPSGAPRCACKLESVCMYIQTTRPYRSTSSANGRSCVRGISAKFHGCMARQPRAAVASGSVGGGYGGGDDLLPPGDLCFAVRKWCYHCVKRLASPIIYRLIHDPLLLRRSRINPHVYVHSAATILMLLPLPIRARSHPDARLRLRAASPVFVFPMDTLNSPAGRAYLPGFHACPSLGGFLAIAPWPHRTYVSFTRSAVACTPNCIHYYYNNTARARARRLFRRSRPAAACCVTGRASPAETKRACACCRTCVELEAAGKADPSLSIDHLITPFHLVVQPT